MGGARIIDGDLFPDSDKINCPKCTSPLDVVVPSETLYLMCPKCSSRISYKKDEIKLVGNPTPIKIKPYIPIGSQGQLMDTSWRVIGFAQFCENKTIYRWREYILYNTKQGHATLAEYDGHWNFIKITTDYPKGPLHTKSFVHSENMYRLYHKYNPQFEFGAGEFYWDITDLVNPNVAEFISPPYALIRESHRNEICWYKGESIRGKEIANAFGVTEPLPRKLGVGSTQELWLSSIHPLIIKNSLLFICLLCVLQLLLNMLAWNKEVFYKTYNNWAVAGAPATLVTSTFDLSKSLLGKANLAIELHANVDNDWFEVSLNLVNDDTGEEYFFEEGVEYYHGYDGGPWTEGSTESEIILSSIPDGKYHFNITPFRDERYAFNAQVDAFSVKVTRDVPSWRNFLIISIFISALIGLYWLRISTFESNRWINSDYGDE